MATEIPSLRTRLFGWARRLAVLGFLGLGGACLLLLGLIMWRGRPWDHVIYAEKPGPHLVCGLAALFMAYLLGRGYRNTAREWACGVGRCVLLAFSACVVLAAGEIGLRVGLAYRANAGSMEQLQTARRAGKPVKIHSDHPLAKIIQPSEDKACVYELQPGLDVDFGHQRVQTNRQGLRASREYPLQRKPGSVRIVGIGDSGMFGWNVSQDEPYLSVMESNLNQRQDGILYEVLNLAVPGYNTQLEVARFRSKGLAYHPDMVVVGWCENDAELPTFLLERENYWTRDKSYLYDLLFRRGLPANDRTEVAHGLTLRDQRSYDRRQLLPELQQGTGGAGVRAALRELKQMSLQAGFKVLVFGPMGRGVRDLCDELGLEYVNTRALIPKDKYPADYLVHYMHPSPDGHRVLAEFLERELARRGWLVPSQAVAATTRDDAGGKEN